MKIYFLGRLWATTIPEDELTADEQLALIARRHRVVPVRCPDGSFDQCDLSDADFDLDSD